ncbi:MAG: hypothetical protein KKG59_07645 [Nanoarchaeota archaeon]|nr:hypothetical protein [Nanoarchaeota archaeon]
MKKELKKVTTKDGSETFYSDEYQEYYHSISGAMEEAFKKFAIPGIKPKLKKKSIRILHICFGLGYLSAAAIHYIRKNNAKMDVDIIGLEIDQAILDKISEIEVPNLIKPDYELIRGLAHNKWELHLGRFHLKMIKGDARHTINDLEGGFDVVFLDPFSPKKCPELWTQKFIKKIYDLMNKKGILTTYSCARSVRNNLEAVGFKVKDGPRVGRRAPSTIAQKT